MTLLIYGIVLINLQRVMLFYLSQIVILLAHWNIHTREIGVRTESDTDFVKYLLDETQVKEASVITNDAVKSTRVEWPTGRPIHLGN